MKLRIGHMNRLMNRHMNRALSTVLTTIIILVASVVLATGVVLYGTSLFQTSTQQESISVSGVKLWTNSGEDNGYTWGAFAVRNSGDKILSVDKITIRGVDVPFAQWYPDVNVTSSKLQQAMNFTGWKTNATAFLINTPSATCNGETLQIKLSAAIEFCADSASGPVGLEPGKGAIIYFQLVNGTIAPIDAGAVTSVGVFAGKTGAPITITIASKA